MSLNKDNLRFLLCELLSPVNEVRLRAESHLNELKSANARVLIIILVDIVCEDVKNDPPSEWTRSLGIILLKGITHRDVDMWKQLDPEEFAETRGKLLALLGRETVPRVKRLLIITLASLAQIQQWDELMACVGQLAASEIESNKALGITMLSKLAEYVGSYLITHLRAWLHSFALCSIRCPYLVDHQCKTRRC